MMKLPLNTKTRYYILKISNLKFVLKILFTNTLDKIDHLNLARLHTLTHSVCVQHHYALRTLPQLSTRAYAPPTRRQLPPLRHLSPKGPGQRLGRTSRSPGAYVLHENVDPWCSPCKHIRTKNIYFSYIRNTNLLPTC